MNRQEWIAELAELGVSPSDATIPNDSMKAPIIPCKCGIGGYYVQHDTNAAERKRPLWHRRTMARAISYRDSEPIVEVKKG